jgi:hypothetical protein
MDYNYMINDAIQICTLAYWSFHLRTKVFIFCGFTKGILTLSFGLGGTLAPNRGPFGNDVPLRWILSFVMCVLTVIVIGVNMVMYNSWIKSQSKEPSKEPPK